MKNAIELSIDSAKSGGGPFGVVIVKNGEIVAENRNSVTIDNDPTAHVEVNAIRKAAKAIHDFNLEGCEIYTSCEPCPMFLSAIYWARILKIHYYSCTKEDALDAGFDDAFIYRELDLPPTSRRIPSQQLLREQAQEAFDTWKSKDDKIAY